MFVVCLCKHNWLSLANTTSLIKSCAHTALWWICEQQHVWCVLLWHLHLSLLKFEWIIIQTLKMIFKSLILICQFQWNETTVCGLGGGCTGGIWLFIALVSRSSCCPPLSAAQFLCCAVQPHVELVYPWRTTWPPASPDGDLTCPLCVWQVSLRVWHLLDRHLCVCGGFLPVGPLHICSIYSECSGLPLSSAVVLTCTFTTQIVFALKQVLPRIFFSLGSLIYLIFKLFLVIETQTSLLCNVPLGLRQVVSCSWRLFCLHSNI